LRKMFYDNKTKWFNEVWLWFINIKEF
jgi:hypothetical protein